MLLSCGGYAQWMEDFSGLANGAEYDNGATQWTTIQPAGLPSLLFSKQEYPGFTIFAVNDTGNEGVWISEEIDISSISEAAIEITWGSYWANSTDYLRAYYKLDGGPETLFGEETGKPDLRIASAASAIVSGHTVQIIIKGKENTTGNYGGYPRMMGIDDVSVSKITYLYSRSSGLWDSTGTWSYAGYGGSSCNCTPDENTHVFIGNGMNINLNSNGRSAGVTIENGRINYTANAVLEIVRGGVLEVATDGTMDRNGNVNASLNFATYTYRVDVDGDLSVRNMTINGANVTFKGSGQAGINGNLRLINMAGKTITTDLAGFNIGGTLNLEASSFEFINKGQLSVANTTLFNGRNIIFNNSGNLHAGNIQVNDNLDDGNVIDNSGMLTAGSVNLNQGDFILNNSGSVIQTGGFSGVSSGSAFHNLSGGVWKVSGAGNHSRLFAGYPGNEFIYNGGDQTLLKPADSAYHHLTLSGSGAKTQADDLVVNGDLQITGITQLDASSGADLNVKGNWTATTSHAPAYVKGSGSTTFSGSGDQTLSAPGGKGVFNRLVVDKPYGALKLASSPAANVETSQLSLTRGGLILNGNTLKVVNPDPAAISRTHGFIQSETSGGSNILWQIGSGTGAYVFPFGKTSDPADYIPFTFEVTSAGAGSGAVSVATHETAKSSKIPAADPITGLMVDRVWQIDLDGFTNNPTAEITFKATAAEVGSHTSLRAQRWNINTSTLDPPLPDQVNPDPFSVTVPGVNQFSPWVMTDGSSALPIELLYFKATPEQGRVNLEWQTASETDNDFFTIEKTTDFHSFTLVGVVNGGGTTTDSRTYTFADRSPFPGVSYYRLTQTDFDGTETVHNPVSIEMPFSSPVRVYPNPSGGKAISFIAPDWPAGVVIPVAVYDSYGRLVFQEAYENRGQVHVAFGAPLISGLYLIRIGNYQGKFSVE